MKPAPPQPGWIERVYRAGVGLAIPLTIIAGVVLLLTDRDGAGVRAPAAERHDTVVMALPLEDARPSVQLRTAPRVAPCGPAGDRRAPCAPEVSKTR
jgi:hypothetical protein